MQKLPFSVWIISFSIKHSKSINIVANGNTWFFLWPSNIPLCLCVCVYHIFLIHSPVDRASACFHILVAVNNDAMNFVVHVSFWNSVLLLSMYTQEWWRRKWRRTPIFLPGESHGQRSLAVYSSWSCKSWTCLGDWTTTTQEWSCQ